MSFIELDVSVILVCAAPGEHPTVHIPFVNSADHQYLIDNDIIDSHGWAVEKGNKKDLPFLSEVKYQNGTSITAEFNKISISQDYITADRPMLKVSDIVSRLLAEYRKNQDFILKAAGINFRIIYEAKDEDNFLKSKFFSILSPEAQKNLKTGEVKLIYKGDDCTPTFSISPGYAEHIKNKKRYTGALITINYHADILDNNIDSALSFIGSLESKHTHALSTSKAILGE